MKFIDVDTVPETHSRSDCLICGITHQTLYLHGVGLTFFRDTVLPVDATEKQSKGALLRKNEAAWGFTSGRDFRICRISFPAACARDEKVIGTLLKHQTRHIRDGVGRLPRVWETVGSAGEGCSSDYAFEFGYTLTMATETSVPSPPLFFRGDLTGED